MNYKDIDRVEADRATLKDILYRQGDDILFETLAALLTASARHYHLTQDEINLVMMAQWDSYQTLVRTRTES